jgi:UDP-GlcNAc:undecaprenyl-phosphate GlcNAc-1-phosphate transferase
MLLILLGLWGLFAALVAGLMTNILTGPMIRFAHALQVLDVPGERKVHVKPIPRMGGVAVMGGVGFATLAGCLAVWEHLFPTMGRTEALAFPVAVGLVFVTGVVDDFVDIAGWKKFGLECLAAVLLVQVGWTVEAVSLPWGGTWEVGWVGPVAAVLWIVGVTNAINLIDGLDGLAGGVAAIIALGLLVYAVLLGNLFTVIVTGSVFGACLGFLPHNWAPAKIYLGDSGSLTLGFLLGAITLESSMKAPAAVAILVPLIALGVPLIDTGFVMLLRFLIRPHSRQVERVLRMFHADRNHLHHLLLHYRDNRRLVVTMIFGSVLLFSALALVVAITRNPLLGLALFLFELLVVLGMRMMGLRARAREVARSAEALVSGEIDEEEALGAQEELPFRTGGTA